MACYGLHRIGRSPGPKENRVSGSFFAHTLIHGQSYAVDCITLDDYCRARDLKLIPRRLLLKMDVEADRIECAARRSWRVSV
jgi:hypothetical protein